MTDLIDGDEHIFIFGNTKVKIVPPPPISKEESEKIIAEMHSVGWGIVEKLYKQGKRL